ncbi:hypothetical protein NDU88_002642 [Pleurodeles waltl]|uniref:Secreted protein n=1 Tax=Pleurodeles waltl TaxID=8319 RepID=A0AAV7TN72_PLEWA|nr:hypothetical protein NDU88_002642 [Pleurodeles waltl]
MAPGCLAVAVCCYEVTILAAVSLDGGYRADNEGIKREKVISSFNTRPDTPEESGSALRVPGRYRVH